MQDSRDCPVQITRLDHVVLTVQDVAQTVAFYEQVLGLRHEVFGGGRHALRFGDQKINLHQAGREFEPKAARATAGSADLCFITPTPLPIVVDHLTQRRVPVEHGPIQKIGALGPIESVYFRDPDGNLLEVSNYR